MPASPASPMTAEDVLHLDLPDKSTELVRGQLLVREPPSAVHGRAAARLLYLLAHHVYSNDLGVVFSQDTGFHIAFDPDTVRAPDVAFVRQARVALIPARGYARLAPDLVVEIRSPDDRRGELLAKVGEWLDGGAALLWVIDPERREAQVYREDGSVGVVPSDGMLDGEDVVPGFRCAIGEVFR